MPGNHTHKEFCMWNTSAWECVPVLIFTLTALPLKTRLKKNSHYMTSKLIVIFLLFPVSCAVAKLNNVKAKEEHLTAPVQETGATETGVTETGEQDESGSGIM